MAERRMFAKTIVLSDDFLDLPTSARCLYFTLGMFADDDGFVNAPKSIMRQCRATEDDMRLLVAKRYLICFDSGVIVIKHWRINNYLRSDRYTETKCAAEKSFLSVSDTGEYMLPNESGIPVGIPDGIPNIGKVNLNKDKLNNTPLTPQKGEGRGVFQEYAKDDKELLAALKEFNEFRNKMKKPMTEESKKRLLSKLEKFPREQWVDILHQSIDRGWQTVYALQEEGGNNGGSKQGYRTGSRISEDKIKQGAEQWRDKIHFDN